MNKIIHYVIERAEIGWARIRLFRISKINQGIILFYIIRSRQYYQHMKNIQISIPDCSIRQTHLIMDLIYQILISLRYITVFTCGECVYSHRYRGYDGSYVFEMEKQLRTPQNTQLILLTTSDWSFIKDDGESFDFSKKEEEQNDFIEAFNRSTLPNKIIIDIAKDGTYKKSKEILNEIFAT